MTDRFVVTSEHLVLLNKMYVSWDDMETGAPCIDPKRPYGNSSVYQDVHEILGWEFDEEDGLTDEQYDRAEKIHSEMETVLQIVLCNYPEIITPGEYMITEKYHSRSWRRA